MEILTVQPTPENPYIVEDYPYGFRLRTQMRVWVEYRQGFGFRYMTQTLNPKTNNWNKPKAGTYEAIILVYKDDDGHIHPHNLSLSAWDSEIQAFKDWAGDYVSIDPYASRLEAMLKRNARVAERYKNITATITTLDSRGKVESVETKVYGE